MSVTGLLRLWPARVASTDLGKAELALWSDPVGTRIVIPHLVAMPITRLRDRVAVRFLGDQFPTGFHSEGRDHNYALSSIYGRDEHAELLDLTDLLDEIAPAAVDRRLLLRTHWSLAPGLDVAVAVEVTGPLTVTPDSPAVAVTFTVQVVQHTFVVT